MKQSSDFSGTSLQKLNDNRSQVSGLTMLINGFNWAKTSFVDKVDTIRRLMQQMKFKIVASTEYQILARHIARILPQIGPISSPVYSDCESLQFPDHVINPDSEIASHQSESASNESEQSPNLAANNNGASSAGMDDLSEATISELSQTDGTGSIGDPPEDQH